MRYIGKEMSRVDGRAKVTGKARYAAEFQPAGTAYGFLVMSAIAKGSITAIDTTDAEKQAGVLKILTHKNAPKLAYTDPKDKDELAPDGAPFRPLQSERILFNAQPIAVVIAETFEQARHAARLVKATYRAEKSATDLKAMKQTAYAVPGRNGKVTPPRGNPVAALESAPAKIEAEYTIPVEHHNPIEPHAAVAAWDDQGKLTIYDKSQYVYNVRNHLASVFGVAAENVNIISPFVGGAFGSALRPNYYPTLAALAAREAKRPVKLVYTRRQMFTGHGYRPYTWQKVSLGAASDGKLAAIIHEAIGNTSSYEDYTEEPNGVARTMYACANVDAPYKLVKTDLPTPFAMRAPGAVTGMFALECAMDELAYALKIDPLQLRLINYAEVDPDTGKPFSSKALRECYAQAAEKFGWSKRNPEPRSMRDGRLLVGWGMATGTWGAYQAPASVRVTLRAADGTALVESAASDMGPGTYTVITMIAAEFLNLPMEKVQFELGDTKLPKAPVHGGSLTTASVGTAVQQACQSLMKKVSDMTAQSGMAATTDFAAVLKKNNLEQLVENHDSKPNFGERGKYSIASHGAQFVEVKVDPDLGTVKVSRVVEATASGKIINPKAAHSQEMGGVVWGIGMALHEATEIDHRYGHILNASLADYHVPVNADVHEIETMFVDEEDKIVNALGIKGMGELGMVGIPAAIANAVYHATAKRIRDLPITPDKLL